MKFLDLTLATSAHNLALDQALLDQAEQDGTADEVLRIWESDRPLVVVGRSSRVRQEVNISACQQDGVAILRRTSGGASIVAGPGCLMYAVVLNTQHRPEIRLIDHAHRFVLERVALALGTLAADVTVQGISDLTINQRKFSGNSLRCQRHHILYHGTILYRFPITLLKRYLRTPPRQPDYRQQRDHEQFVDNFPASRAEIVRALQTSWNIAAPLRQWPRQLVEQLVAERYSQASWNFRL